MANIPIESDQGKTDASSAEKVHTIYRIDLGILKKEYGSELTSFADVKDAFEKQIGGKHGNKSNRKKDDGYKKLPINQAKTENLNVRIAFYLKKSCPTSSEFLGFYTSILENKQQLKKKYSPIAYSSILLIWLQSQNKAYAITTGFARYDIQSIIEKNFGLKALSEAKDKIEISSRTVKPLEGIVYSQHETYRQKLSVNNIKTSSGIIGKITGKLSDANYISKLRSKKKDEAQVTALDYIKIGAKANFENLCQFLEFISDKSEDAFNDVKPCKCQEELWKRENEHIWDEIRNYFIFPPHDIEAYLSADTYNLKLDEEKICEDGRACEITMEDVQAFYNQCKNRDDFWEKAQLVYTCGEDAKEVPLKSCLNRYDKNAHNGSNLLRNGIFYKYSEPLNNRLNAELKYRLNDVWLMQDIYEIKTKAHKINANEDAILNAICRKGRNSYKFHKVYIESAKKVELADIITKQNGTYYFTHAKMDFNCNMRALQKQIEISILTLTDILRSLSSEREDKLKEYINNQNKKENKETKTKKSLFNDLKTNNFEYVACIIIKDQKINNVDEFRNYVIESDSIFAKCCLNELLQFCSRMGVKLSLLPVILSHEVGETYKATFIRERKNRALTHA